MAIKSATVLKSYFVKDSYSTEEQFVDLIDSCTNTLITGDMTVDSSNVATVNPIKLQTISEYSTTVTRLASQGSGTVTVNTPFAPALVFATTSSVDTTLQSGGIGRSNGIDNSCVYGRKQLISGGFTGLGQISRNWYSICTAPNSDVYACELSGDIYKQTGGVGNFVALGQTSRFWASMCAAPNGDIYAGVLGGSIYKQTGGVGNFVTLSQTSRQWFSMCAAPNGDIYAGVDGGDIYMQTGGVGNFIGLSQTSRNWDSMTASSNGDIYAANNGGDIYMQTNGTGNFIALGQTSRIWRGMGATPNGDIYACVDNGDIYKQTSGIGNFIALGQTNRHWYSMAGAPNGNIYACVSGQDIYKQTSTIPIIVDNSSLNFSIANWQIDDTGFTGIINNFTSNSFDIEFTMLGAGVDTVVTLDIIK